MRELILSLFLPSVPRDETQVVRIGHRCLYPLSHLVNPDFSQRPLKLYFRSSIRAATIALFSGVVRDTERICASGRVLGCEGLPPGFLS